MQSFDGPVSLQEMRGKVVLLFFGYTSCADVCPTTLWALSKMFSELSAQEIENITALFVSLDPERDTPEVLHKYTQLFHSNITGVTARGEILAEVANNYGVSFERRDDPASTLGYMIYHTPDVLIIDAQGKLLEARMELSSDARAMAAHIRDLLTQKQSP